MRARLRETVREFADTFIECADGDCQACLPHWVLRDLQMPRVDGFTASRQISASYPDVQICLVTDYGDARTRRASQEVGATAFVLKENLEELRTLLGAGT